MKPWFVTLETAMSSQSQFQPAAMHWALFKKGLPQKPLFQPNCSAERSKPTDTSFRTDISSIVIISRIIFLQNCSSARWFPDVALKAKIWPATSSFKASARLAVYASSEGKAAPKRVAGRSSQSASPGVSFYHGKSANIMEIVLREYEQSGQVLDEVIASSVDETLRMIWGTLGIHLVDVLSPCLPFCKASRSLYRHESLQYPSWATKCSNPAESVQMCLKIVQSPRTVTLWNPRLWRKSFKNVPSYPKRAYNSWMKCFEHHHFKRPVWGYLQSPPSKGTFIAKLQISVMWCLLRMWSSSNELAMGSIP